MVSRSTQAEFLSFATQSGRVVLGSALLQQRPAGSLRAYEFQCRNFQEILAGPSYPGQSKTGANYNLEFKMGYRMAPNWFVGSFVNANNTADYSSQSVGFTVRYLMMQSPSNYNLQLNSIPDWKGGQFFRLQ
jgi:hypothetical protein